MLARRLAGAGEAGRIIRASGTSSILQTAQAYARQLSVIEGRQRAAEQALRESQANLEMAVADIADRNLQLQKASRQQSDFIATLSHELRTPLSGILGFAEVLLEGMDGELNDAQRQDLGQMQACGQALLALVNDLLDESKIESGQMSLETGCVYLKSLIDKVTMKFRALADQKSLYVRSDVPDCAEVLADELRLTQVLTNLISNAIKFTSEGGVSISCVAAGGLWRVSVTDTGIGMADETKGLVFERFRQADASPTRKFGGMGLGLAIACSLVTMQGGDIGVDSTLGRGSTFWFTMPAFARAPAVQLPITLFDADVAHKRALRQREQPVDIRLAIEGQTGNRLNQPRAG